MAKDIFLTNSLGGKKEKFTPKNEKSIGMYVCGPTVYDDPHIGNARPLVIFDILYKILKNKYGLSSMSVIFLIYFTDVDPYLFFKILYRISKTTNGLALPICGSS